ncbi:hypothetical protein J6R97_06725 [bacterium]|nr:hypothetical protein [bacterium]
MEKKYYDLIITLIKNHRRYPGLESLLEEIANDVYERSKVIFETIDNETTISEYIKKVVATSIVTVPKKIDLNINLKQRANSSLIVELLSNNSSKIIDNSTDDINSELGVQDEFEDFVEENDSELEVQEEFEDFVEENDSELEVQDEFEDFVEENDSELEVQDEFEDFVEENNSELEVQEEFEDFVEENDSELEVQEEFEDSVEENDSDEIDNELIEVEQSVNDDVGLLQQEKVNKDLVDMMINGVSNSNDDSSNTVISEQEDFSPSDEFDNSMNDLLEVETDLLEVVEEGLELETKTIDNDASSLILEEQVELQLEENVEDLVYNNETSQNDSTKNLTIYDCFYYDTQEYKFDKDEIKEYLQELENQHLQCKVLLVYDLKYNKKQTVTKIAKELDFTNEQVVETLKYIAETLGEYFIDAMSQM